VYILQCSDGSYYVGSTWDVERRLAQHNAGDGAQYTKRRRPVELLWTQDCERVEDAFALEKQIQG
jgi:putative endonuclease